MTPISGGVLDRLNNALNDPLLAIVARLAKSPTAENPDSISLSQLVECDFPGYAPVPITPSIDIAIDGADYGEVDPFRVRWESGAVVTPQNITFLYVTKTYNGVDNSLVQVLAFPIPLRIESEGQVLEFDVGIAAHNFN